MLAWSRDRDAEEPDADRHDVVSVWGSSWPGSRWWPASTPEGGVGWLDHPRSRDGWVCEVNGRRFDTPGHRDRGQVLRLTTACSLTPRGCEALNETGHVQQTRKHSALERPP